MAKIILSDEDDIVIAEVERGDHTVSGHPRISSIFIENSKGEFLLAKRSLEKTVHPGMWGPSAAGVVEEGESYEDGIIRETKEEIGIDLEKFTKGPKVLRDKQENTGKYWRQSFYARMDISIKDLKLQEREVVEAQWFSRDQIKKMYRENPHQFTSFVEELDSWLK